MPVFKGGSEIFSVSFSRGGYQFWQIFLGGMVKFFKLRRTFIRALVSVHNEHSLKGARAKVYCGSKLFTLVYGSFED